MLFAERPKKLTNSNNFKVVQLKLIMKLTTSPTRVN